MFKFSILHKSLLDSFRKNTNHSFFNNALLYDNVFRKFFFVTHKPSFHFLMPSQHFQIAFVYGIHVLMWRSEYDHWWTIEIICWKKMLNCYVKHIKRYIKWQGIQIHKIINSLYLYCCNGEGWNPRCWYLDTQCIPYSTKWNIVYAML